MTIHALKAKAKYLREEVVRLQGKLMEVLTEIELTCTHPKKRMVRDFNTGDGYYCPDCERWL